MMMIRLWRIRFAVVFSGWFLLLGARSAFAQVPPPNDAFANATAIPSTASNVVTGSNLGATHENGEPFHAGQDVTPHTVWWSWTPPVTGSYAVSTVGSSFDTVLAVYLGSVVSNLTVLAATDDDAGGNGAEQFIFRAIVGETYHIVVDGSFGAVGAIQLSIYPGGHTVAPWEVRTLGGYQIGTLELSNKVVLVDFWETICQACVQEIPQLIQLQNALQAKGFTLVGLYENSGTAADIQGFMQQTGMNYPVGSGDMLDVWFGHELGFPRKYLIDREGRVLSEYFGGNTLSNYLAMVTPFLREAAVPARISLRSGGDILIAWPQAASGYGVESSTNLASKQWTLVAAPGSVQIINGQHTVVIHPTARTQFFRLRQP